MNAPGGVSPARSSAWVSRPRPLVIAVFLLTACVSAAAQVQRDRPTTPRDKPAEPTGTASIAGIVVTADERQQPVRRVSVMLASGQVATPRTVVTDDEGRFEFTALAPGNYTLVGRNLRGCRRFTGLAVRWTHRACPSQWQTGSAWMGCGCPSLEVVSSAERCGCPVDNPRPDWLFR
jgi:hypothetical protein